MEIAETSPDLHRVLATVREGRGMAEYTVLYHDPIRLTAAEREHHAAGHSVWVCRDDRYAFEVVVYAPRPETPCEPSAQTCGEARYRLALALVAADAARRAAEVDPLRSDVVVAECTRGALAAQVAAIETDRRVNFGAVIGRFWVDADDVPMRRAG